MADDEPVKDPGRSRWRAPPGAPLGGDSSGGRRIDRRSLLAAAVLAAAVAAGGTLMALALRPPTPAPSTVREVPGQPAPREGAAMAYDPATKSVLMYGGDDGTTVFGDTWSWDGSAWSALHPDPAPPPLTGAVIGYDPASRQLVMTGGSTGYVETTAMSDTWTWDGRLWWPAVEPTPSPGPVTVATDDATGQLLLVSGLDGDCQGMQTWVWRSAAWQRLTSEASPGPTSGALLVYDPAARDLLLYATSAPGCPGQGQDFPTTSAWSWDGTSWDPIPSAGSEGSASGAALVGSGQVIDSTGGALLIGSSRTYRWDHGGWTELGAAPAGLGRLTSSSASARCQEALAYDASRHQVVLFGGRFAAGLGDDYLADTWTFAGQWRLARMGTVLGWTPTPAPSPCTAMAEGPGTGLGESVYSLHMESATTGWALDSAGSIVHTTSAAGRWSVSSPPLPPGAQVVAAAFLDGSTARALTGSPATCEPGTAPAPGPLQAWATGDGGRSWTAEGTLTAAYVYGSLDFVDPEHGWFIDLRCEGPSSCWSTVLFRTTDAGATWQQVATSALGKVGPAGRLPAGLDQPVSFSDPSTGWIAGDQAGVSPNLFVSHDGGASWSAQPLPSTATPPKGGAETPVFWSSQDGAVLASSGGGEGGSALYITSDGGCRWIERNLPDDGLVPDAIDFIDSATGWLLAEAASAGPGGAQIPPYSLWVTRDGGETWARVWTGGSLGFSEIDFVTAQLGWAVTYDENGLAGLVRTADGGTTWTPVPILISG